MAKRIAGRVKSANKAALIARVQKSLAALKRDVAALLAVCADSAGAERVGKKKSRPYSDAKNSGVWG